MIIRLAAVALALTGIVTPAAAEPFFPWDDNDASWSQSDRAAPSRPFRAPPAPSPQIGGDVRDGGPRPEVSPKAPIVVAFYQAEYAAGSIVIDSGARKLYFVLPGNRAFQYPISVGREGFAWAGTEKISRKQAWPDWHPPADMRRRDPKLPVKMTGGLKNPLGAMALYLGNTLYRIHGTNDERTIGHASSSGCFRMMNSSVLHLAQFAQIGTPVTVVNRLPNQPQSPPVASARPPRQTPPLAANEPQRLPPPQAVPRDAFDDDQPEEIYPGSRDRFGEEPDVADVRVTPRRNLDDYDPYARQPYDNRRYAPDRYGDRYRERPDSYANSRVNDEGRGRVWYDDERDDF